MKTIWKFQLPLNGTDIIVPKGAEVLSCQVQRGTPCIWLLVDTDQPNEIRRFVILSTGESTTENLRFIDTYQIAQGEFVFHVFEIICK